MVSSSSQDDGNLFKSSIEWIRSTLMDRIPQLVDIFKDLDPDVQEAALTVFEQLSQHGQLLLPERKLSNIYLFLELFQNAVKEAVTQVVDMFQHSAGRIRRISVTVFRKLAHYGQ
jgi:hypothetical protein